MDELEQIKESIAAMKETLIFLVEQEKIRGNEVTALNEKIEAVNETLVEKIINPSIEAYNEGQYNQFKDKYGERLGKYDETLKSSMNDPEYDSTKEAWNELSEMSPEDRADVDIDKYVDGVEQGLTEYVENIKKSLGIPSDTAVEITETPEGEVEVKADENGDGTPETVVATESEETTIDNETGAETEEETAEETDEVDPELQKELDEWSKAH